MSKLPLAIAQGPYMSNEVFMIHKEINYPYQRTPQEIHNSFRRFGHFGPVYQVIGFSRETEKGAIMMKIHVFETNEDLEYPFLSILEDPQENN
jgi:hypothetical protein